MTKSLIALVAAVAATSFAAGCGTVSGGETVVKYNRSDKDPRMGEAPADGTYALYGTFDANKQVQYKLKEGDPLGFKKNDDGSISAVAGTNVIPVETSALSRSVYWRAVKPK